MSSLRPARTQYLPGKAPVPPREGHSRWTKAERDILKSEREKDPPTSWDDISEILAVDGYVRHNASNCQEAWEKHIRESKPSRISPRLSRRKKRVDEAEPEPVEDEDKHVEDEAEHVEDEEEHVKDEDERSEDEDEQAEDEDEHVEDGPKPAELVKESKSSNKGKRAIEDKEDEYCDPASPAKKARSASKSKAA